MFMPSCDFFFNSTHEVLATVFCVLFSLFQFLVTIRKQRALVDDVGSTNTCFVCLLFFSSNASLAAAAAGDPGVVVVPKPAASSKTGLMLYIVNRPETRVRPP